MIKILLFLLICFPNIINASSGICSTSNFENMKVIGILILIVKYVVPIIIIAISSYEFYLTFAGKNNKSDQYAFRQLIRKLTYAVILFLIPIIILFVLKITINDFDKCYKCLNHPFKECVSDNADNKDNEDDNTILDNEEQKENLDDVINIGSKFENAINFFKNASSIEMTLEIEKAYTKDSKVIEKSIINLDNKSGIMYEFIEDNSSDTEDKIRDYNYLDFNNKKLYYYDSDCDVLTYLNNYSFATEKNTSYWLLNKIYKLEENDISKKGNTYKYKNKDETIQIVIENNKVSSAIFNYDYENYSEKYTFKVNSYNKKSVILPENINEDAVNNSRYDHMCID